MNDDKNFRDALTWIPIIIVAIGVVITFNGGG